MSARVVEMDNRSTSDNWIVNSTDEPITVACDQQQAGKFSVNLQPGERQRVAPGIKAQPYPNGKQKYDQFQYDLGSSEVWEVQLDSGELVMQMTQAGKTRARDEERPGGDGQSSPDPGSTAPSTGKRWWKFWK